MTAEALVVITEELTRTALPHLRTLLTRVVANRPGRLVVDLSQTPTVDADGIELLLDLHRRQVAGGGELVLRAPGPRVCRLLDLARVSGVLSIEGGRPIEDDRRAEVLR